MKLFLGNRNYSSWSLRGWLAAKQSGLPFEEVILPMFGEGWDDRRTEGDLAPSHGRVPVLWDGDIAEGGAVVWDSLAIIEYLADKVGRDRFWPKEDAARGMARSLVAEMHSSFTALRSQCPVNIRARIPEHKIDEAARADTIRVLTLWAEARARFGKGGPYLFGTFSAADIAFAPVVTRFVTYGFTLPGFAMAYAEAITEHPWMQEWIAGAEEEQWVIEQYEVAPKK